VIDVPFTYAFTAGLVSAVNPCGFPMLPAYLSFFIELDDESEASGTRVPQALVSALAVSLGFFVVFVGLGFPINAGVTSIYRWMPWLTIVIGVALAALGVAMLAGYRLKVMLPRLDRGGRDRTFGSMFAFGVSYAIASLSCTIGIYLAVVVGTTNRENLVSGVVALFAYAAGMTAVLVTLAVAIALARDGLVHRLRSLLQYVDRVAGMLLTLVGAYLVYYGVYSIGSDDSTNNPVGVIEDWSARSSSWLQRGGVKLGLGMAALALLGAVWAVTRKRASS
jgi:cytochrome c biogenesis protein CcdA